MLLKAAKRRAVETNRTLTAVIEDALRAALLQQTKTKRACVKLPVSGHGGTLPSVNLDHTAELYDIMDGRRLS